MQSLRNHVCMRKVKLCDTINARGCLFRQSSMACGGPTVVDPSIHAILPVCPVCLEYHSRLVTWQHSLSFILDHSSDLGLVEQDTLAKFLRGLAVSNSSKVENLDIRQLVPLDSSHTPSLVKLDLPDAAEIAQQILDTLASSDVPHLDRLLAAANNFAAIVLETGDSPSMRHKSITAPAILGIPDTEGRVSRRRHESFISEIK